jgi:hypothetical protein
VAARGNHNVVLYAHANALFGDVNARLAGDNHVFLPGRAVVAGVVSVQAQKMRGAMREIAADVLAGGFRDDPQPASAVRPCRASTAFS